MVDREEGEDVENEGPDDDEEEEDEEDDGPGGGVLAGPEVLPVAAEGGGEEVVLEDDGDEEPLVEMMRISTGVDQMLSEGGELETDYYDLSTIYGGVEGWHLARVLSIVIWQAQEENDTHAP